MGSQCGANRADLDELSDPDFAGLRIEAEHEMRCKMLFEDRQTSCPSAFGRMKNSGPRRRQIYVLIEMWNAADMLDFEPSRLIEPGFDGHRASPSCVERNLIGSIFGCNSGRPACRGILIPSTCSDADRPVLRGFA